MSLRGLSTMAALVLAVTLVLLGVTYPVVVASLALGIGGLVAVRLGES